MAADTELAALYEVRDRVALITLNRPDARNAVNAALSTAVGAGLEAAVADPDVRVIVITGAGQSFCAGADLKELAQGRSIHAEGHAVPAWPCSWLRPTYGTPRFIGWCHVWTQASA